MTDNNTFRPLRIYMAYSLKDEARVEALYDFLKTQRWLDQPWLDPWMISQDLLGGQETQLAIIKEINKSDVALPCLSLQTVDQAGQLQRSINQILDKVTEQPEDAIFLVPLRLDDCKIPEKLKVYTVVDWFKPRGRESLLSALRRKAYLSSIAPLPLPIEDRPAREGKIKFLRTGRILYLQRLTTELRRLIVRFDYTGTLVLIENALGNTLWNNDYKEQLEALKLLLLHAQQRLLFSFEIAEENLARFLKLRPNQEIAPLCAYYPLAWQNVWAGNEEASAEALRFGCGAVAELYWNVDLQWRTGHYADYLARFKTLTDRLYILALELITGVPLSFEEASYNQARLEAKDFTKLNGLHEAYKNHFKPNIGFGRVPNEAFKLATEMCRAGSVEQRLAEYHEFVPIDLPAELNNERLKKDVPEYQPALVTKEHFKSFLGGVGEDAFGLAELLQLTNAEQNPVFTLTRLRNSLPPAHSFGTIDATTIIEATVQQTDWPENAPHLRIGQILGTLYCWRDYFEEKLAVPSPQSEQSPFEVINQALYGLLTEIEQGEGVEQR